MANQFMTDPSEFSSWLGEDFDLPVMISMWKNSPYCRCVTR
jgi:hypothetical protein